MRQSQRDINKKIRLGEYGRRNTNADQRNNTRIERKGCDEGL